MSDPGPDAEPLITTWLNCAPRSDDGSYIYRTQVSADFTDFAASDSASRNLFLAGVFAAILGALAIEILNGTFDVAEAWSGRRRTRRDEQEQEQRPDPTPDPDDPPDEPYNPGPGGYL